MDNDLFAEKLSAFKEDEKPEVVLLVGDDEVLTKIVLAWTNTAVRRAEKQSPLKADSEDEVWRWLWKNIKYSREELMAKRLFHNPPVTCCRRPKQNRPSAIS